MRTAILLLTLLLLLLPACAPAGSGATPRGEEERMEITGKIVHVPLEGGFFGLVADDGTRYEPANLPPAFRQDGLPVRVEARRREGAAGFRMWGVKIQIIAIEKNGT